MSRLRFEITMSLDGYVAGPNQSEENPLGEGAQGLHDWAFGQKAFREPHGREGGETGPDNDVILESLENVGAEIMGRNMFGPIRGPWGDDPWKGWWGEEPPFHTPVFVLTHHEREPLEMEGGTTFHFVTDGIEPALEQAREAAGGKDVHLGGGAEAAQQYLAAGLIDEMQIHVVPRLLGDGSRLFESTGGRQAGMELDRVLSSAQVTHYRFKRPA